MWHIFDRLLAWSPLFFVVLVALFLYQVYRDTRPIKSGLFKGRQFFTFREELGLYVFILGPTLGPFFAMYVVFYMLSRPNW